MQTGKSMGLKPGHTSTIRRVEGGMLSYHADMDINTNPIELGMDRMIDLDKDFNFIGKTALETISKNGVSQKHIGIEIFCDPMNGPNTKFWNILNNEEKVIGKVTSAVYSPRLKKNIGLAMILSEYSLIGTEIIVDQVSTKSKAIVVDKPFYDPNKALAKS
jgi:aminomethyltransferase